MPDYPLLLFPRSARAKRVPLTSRRTKIRLPELDRQAARLAPQFERLQTTLDHQRISLKDNTFGLQPEQVLVLETIGPVENFVNAVKRIQMEWLAEYDLDSMPPEHGFEDEADPQRLLSGRLFLVMTDQRALSDMRSLFERWRRDHSIVFPYGLAPLRQAFVHLRSIRPWGAEDRIRDTGVMEDWKERLDFGQEDVPFEVEFWFRHDLERRRQAHAYVQSLVNSLGGSIVQSCAIQDIAYHAVLGRLPCSAIPRMLPSLDAMQDFRLLQCVDVMYVRPVGQCAIRVADAEETEAGVSDQRGARQFSLGEPVVALFDGVPMARHLLLDGRLTVDDPDDYESTYQAHERCHGTAMASLICRGDLNEEASPLGSYLYVRPILQPSRRFDGLFVERIPDNVLPVDLVHRAVRRLFEDEQGEPAVAPTVRVINLSICDAGRPLDRESSPWARLLDWLSWKYNVLFIVSAGNHSRDLTLGVSRSALPRLSPAEREQTVVKALVEDTRHRRLLSPAETLNGLTVASAHKDSSSPPGNAAQVDPFPLSVAPATYSAHGPGFRRAIKPDLLMEGGRQYLAQAPANLGPHSVLSPVDSGRPPGQKVATPGAPGQLNRVQHTRGTSNSAALTSRWAASVLGCLEQVRESSGGALPVGCDTALMKALLVHGAEWGAAGSLYREALETAGTSGALADLVVRFLGYGLADVQKATSCTKQRVTVIGAGQLTNGEADEYAFPMPPSLSASTEQRRLIVTLAWLTPVNPARRTYRGAHLWFDPKNGLTPQRTGPDWHAVQRGTVQHEVLEGAAADDFQDGEKIVIAVNCRADAMDIFRPVRYGLAVTLEVGEAVNLPIYEEVRERLQVRVSVAG